MLIEKIETDQIFRSLYSRYLAWKRRRIPNKVAKGLSFVTFSSIERERMLYLKKLSRKEVKKEVEALRRAEAKRIQDRQTQASKIQDRDQGGSRKDRTQNDPNLSNIRARGL
jgi:hypothetical protein